MNWKPFLLDKKSSKETLKKLKQRTRIIIWGKAYLGEGVSDTDCYVVDSQ